MSIGSKTFLVLVLSAFVIKAIRKEDKKHRDTNKLVIRSITDVSPNVKLFEFKIPPSFGSFNVPIGCYLSAHAEINGKSVTRNYVPITGNDTNTFFLLIKRYDKGIMSSYIHTLKPGNAIELTNPINSFKYIKNANKTMGFLSAGTGIVQPFQIIKGILESSEGMGDDTNILLVYQSHSNADILLRKEIERLAGIYSMRFQVVLYISTKDETNSFSPEYIENAETSSQIFIGKVIQLYGRVDEISIKKLLVPSICEFVCVSGPDSFNEDMKKYLVNENHTFGNSLYVFS
jgi:ferredoxin-NADP reductase